MTNQGEQVSLKDANALYLKEESERRSKEQLTVGQIRKALEQVTGKMKDGGTRAARPRGRQAGQ